MASLGDNLHETAKPISGENKKTIISLSSTELAQGVVNVNLTHSGKLLLSS